jgi:dipeptidyl-peptidase-4
MRLITIIFLATCLIVRMAHAQNGPGPADYKRAVGFLWTNVNNKKAFNVTATPRLLPDSAGFWYVDQSRDKKTFTKVLFSKVSKEPLFDHGRIAAILTDSLHRPITATELPFNAVEPVGKSHVRFVVEGRTYLINTKDNTLSREQDWKSSPESMEAKSPDGKWIAYTENYNLFIRSTESGSVKQLSTAGRKNFEYGTYYGWSDIMEGEGGERPKHFRVNWSPDSKYLQTFICDLRNGNKMYLLDWSVDTLYRPKLLSYYRGSPGDTTIVYMIPAVYEMPTGREIAVDIPKTTHTNPAFFRWSKTASGQLFVGYPERGYQKHYMVRLDLRDGKRKEFITESSKTNIDHFDFGPIEKRGKAWFISERSGWSQLYTIDLKDHSVKHLAPGNYFVDDVLSVDDKGGYIYFTASGREPGRNPYFRHVYRASLDNNEVKLLTPENAHHDATGFPGGKYFYDEISTAQQPTRAVLREGKTGKMVLELFNADITGLAAGGWKAPETFTATGKDGKTEIYGAMWKPTNFDPAKKYPVIDQTYTGPHTQQFPRNFNRAVVSGNQALAELGFVVVTVDGLGTAGRSKAFHDYSYKALGYGTADHVLAIQQLAKKYPWIDATRVGIFGHSAGGYDAAHAMLQFPDFYKVGVASSADHDHRMEKDWWPEMYMGWPVDTAYHNQSNITMASRLKGKLLITHGGIDENVNPSATFKMAEALIKADKQFDLLILPSQRHGYTGKYNEYFTKKRWNYFVQHLIGTEPVWEFKFTE